MPTHQSHPLQCTFQYGFRQDLGSGILDPQSWFSRKPLPVFIFIIKFGDFTQERCGAYSTEKKKCAASPSLQAKVVKEKN